MRRGEGGRHTNIQLGQLGQLQICSRRHSAIVHSQRGLLSLKRLAQLPTDKNQINVKKQDMDSCVGDVPQYTIVVSICFSTIPI